jgi:hypothetical protein
MATRDGNLAGGVVDETGSAEKGRFVTHDGTDTTAAQNTVIYYPVEVPARPPFTAPLAPTLAANEVDYGLDVSTFPDLDVTGRTIGGVRVVAECTLRRLTTPNGTLEYDPDFGRDVRDLLNEDFDEQDLRREQVGIANEVEKDERILRADVVLKLDAAAFKLTIRITGELAGAARAPFEFVLAISKVSAAVLKAA